MCRLSGAAPWRIPSAARNHARSAGPGPNPICLPCDRHIPRRASRGATAKRQRPGRALPGPSPALTSGPTSGLTSGPTNAPTPGRRLCVPSDRRAPPRMCRCRIFAHFPKAACRSVIRHDRRRCQPAPQAKPLHPPLRPRCGRENLHRLPQNRRRDHPLVGHVARRAGPRDRPSCRAPQRGCVGPPPG